MFGKIKVRTVLAVISTLLLTCVLASVFDIQPVAQAEPSALSQIAQCFDKD